MSTDDSSQPQSPPRVGRRQFLRGIAIGTGASLLAACGASNPAAAPTNAPGSAPTAATTATDAPAAVAPTAATAPVATSAPAVTKSVTLTLMQNKGEFSDEELKQFTDANPGITVERLDQDNTRLKAMLAAGSPPDMIRSGGGQVPPLILQNALLDLTPYMEQSSLIKIDDLAPAVGYFRWDGTELGKGGIYAMHKDWSPDFSLFVNSAAFEEAGVALPSTTEALKYQDIRAMAEKLTKRSGNRIERFGFDFNDGIANLNRILLEQDQHLITPDFTKMVLKDNPLAVEVLRFWFEVAQENVSYSPLNPSASWSGEDYVKGGLAAAHAGFWFGNFVQTADGSTAKDTTVMLPAPTWSGKRLNPCAGGACTAIASATKNPDAAWKLFEFYNGGEPAKTRAKSGGGVPALKSLYSLIPSETPFQQQTLAVLQGELAHSDVIFRNSPYYDDGVFGKSYSTNLERAMRKEIAFEEMVENIENDVNQAIADGRSAAGV